jgi:hypothetical protein
LIGFYNGETGRKAKPPGVHSIELKWYMCEEKPVSVDELIYSIISTRTPIRFEFKESDRGKRIYFCLRWMNTRGEKGPWGNIEYTVVP